jgi:uncharacterized RDD family membrane protein YckC
VYCSKCGGSMSEGAAFCSNCGQAFSVPVAVPRTLLAPSPAGLPAYAGVASGPRVDYAGFWLRLLALIIDNTILLLGFVLVLIPLIFLTGLHKFLDDFHPDDDMNNVGIAMFMGIILVAATVSLILTWLYHALMESSDWQATLGKKALGLVVTDMAGQRVSFGRSTGRHFGKLITNLIPAFLGYVMAGFTEKRQALHDMMSGCLVLRRTS